MQKKASLQQKQKKYFKEIKQIFGYSAFFLLLLILYLVYSLNHSIERIPIDQILEDPIIPNMNSFFLALLGTIEYIRCCFYSPYELTFRYSIHLNILEIMDRQTDMAQSTRKTEDNILCGICHAYTPSPS